MYNEVVFPLDTERTTRSKEDVKLLWGTVGNEAGVPPNHLMPIIYLPNSGWLLNVDVQIDTNRDSRILKY